MSLPKNFSVSMNNNSDEKQDLDFLSDCLALELALDRKVKFKKRLRVALTSAYEQGVAVGCRCVANNQEVAV